MAEPRCPECGSPADFHGQLCIVCAPFDAAEDPFNDDEPPCSECGGWHAASPCGQCGNIECVSCMCEKSYDDNDGAPEEANG